MTAFDFPNRANHLEWVAQVESKLINDFLASSAHWIEPSSHEWQTMYSITIREGDHLVASALARLAAKGLIYKYSGAGSKKWLATPYLLTMTPGPTTWVPIATQWANVNGLVEQATECFRQDFAVAAAVTIRTAIEEAVEHSRTVHSVTTGANSKAAAKQDQLFNDPTFKSSWRPNSDPVGPDQSSTRATLHDARNLGNDATHTGTVTDPPRLLRAVTSVPAALNQLSRVS